MKQYTLKKAYTFEGKGLHTGCYTHLTLKPAPENTGVVFVRTDLPGAPFMPALAEYVSNTARSTAMSLGECVVGTVEHVLSALTGAGVDNAYVEVDNAEMPILDGSALPYMNAILADGVVEQDAERKYIELPCEVELRNEKTGSVVKLTPADDFSYDIQIDFDSKVVGVQTACWTPDMDYAREVAPCRTFVFFHELEFLLNNNLIKGGDVDNAIVIVEHPVTDAQVDRMAALFNQPKLHVSGGYLDNVELHFDNECARHKLLDIIGDLRLCGGFLKARVTAVRSGHTINTNTAKKVREILNK